MPTQPTASVVVPAHDEATTIGRCLASLLRDAEPGEFEVVVAANGCTDETVARAREHAGVTVLDLPPIGKAAALNRGDAAVTAFPRIYLDADVELSTRAARAVARELRSGVADVAAPRPRPRTAGASPLVRAYYSIWSDLPVITQDYVGSGVYAVSADGHRRVAPFPDVVADDQYVRRRFPAARRSQVADTFDFHPARTVRALVHRSIRVRQGNQQLLASVPDLAPEDSSRGLAGVLDVVRRRPTLAPHALVFLAVGLAVRRGVRRSAPDSPISWNRDASTR